MTADPKTIRELRAGLGGHGVHTAEPECPVPYSALDRSEFADLAKAFTAWEMAVHKREDAQLDYEDAESAYARDLAAWNRDQQALCRTGCPGRRCADRNPGPSDREQLRTARGPNEPPRRAGHARRAERSSNGRSRVPQGGGSNHRVRRRAAARAQRPRPHRARRGARPGREATRSTGARPCVTDGPDRGRDRRGRSWSPERARQRHALERAHFYTAEQFGRRAAREHDQRLDEAMSTLRGYVEAVAAENFAAAWPDHADPAFHARRTATGDRARGASFVGIR
ncbi:hypothetical protein FHX34_1047 [Actinoplanes teichomyceticus]|uniref:Uncharacterized protein n=1 Tax=Actinoplanes teichomyceticus TaxID=1867 RepID=A0A561VQ57_ACTTI|nr:hypothetical protein FHX34_1047 [Actinoplanes teichomyceticus]